jgi:hypothetical protein
MRGAEVRTMTLDEILAALAEHVGDDKAKGDEAAKAIRERVKPVAQHLINVGSALKKDEVKADIKKLTEERDAAIQERDEATEAMAAANAAKPDVAKIEADLTTKWSKKVSDLKDQLKAKDDTLRGALRKGTVSKFTAELIANGADPDWAEQVAVSKYGNLIEVKDDGSVLVKSPDGLEYDGDEAAKVKAFATDVGKLVPPKFRLTNADSGAGVRTGGSGSTYDAAKEGREMAEKQKVENKAGNLAFT